MSEKIELIAWGHAETPSGKSRADGAAPVDRALARLEPFAPSRQSIKNFRIMAAIGAGVFLLTLYPSANTAWASVLLCGLYMLGLGLAGLFFVAVQYLSGAGWSVALRRIPEALAALIPVGAAGILLVLLLRPSLYEWTHPGESYLGFKAVWLNYPFLLVRAALYIAIWVAFARAILRHSRAQDSDGDLRHTRKNVALSAAFVVLFALTVWLASVDWLMSLEPHWFSTIFGLYNFAGLFSGGIAGMILIAIWLRASGRMQHLITDDHFHDLGKLLLSFTTFWAYIWFSQYMLIWYANIPEETGYYVTRLSGIWMPLFVVNLLVNWVIPFFVLLPRACKRDSSTLGKVAVVVLVGRWLDLYLMIFPALGLDAPLHILVTAAITVGAAGVFGLVLLRALRQAPLVPLKDPYLNESLHYQQ
jgi:hypothetical protein